MGQDEDSSGSGAAIALARLLAVAAAGDTLFRDVYLARAWAMLEPVCSEARYRSALEDRTTVDRLLAQSRVAIGRQEWVQVEQLAARAAQLRRALDAEQAALVAADEVYGARPVALDPFSRGLAQFAPIDRSETLAALERLGCDDAPQRDLYVARARAIAALASAATTTTAEPEESGVSAARRALAAVERGDVATLARLAQSLVGAGGPKAGDAGAPAAARRFEVPAILAQPYPDACVTPALAFGLESVEFREQSPESAARIRAFLEQYAYAASPATHEQARDGVAELRASFEALPALEDATAGVLAETVSLFALQLYVNSAGIRYLPILSEREFVLIETHAEGDDAPSALLRALRLEQRRALSRDEIEMALVRRGGDVVASIGLDPHGFRLVCVPPDVYMRVAPGRGWGARQEWTHFDGYQVRTNGRLLALVGGNARYGGIADLCGIGSSDARDNVVARFAVVRRERLATRLV